MTVCWDVAQCSVVEVYRRFRGAYCLHHQGDKWLIALMMEAVSTSETSINVYQTTRRNVPEESRYQTRHCENLKSHVPTFSSTSILVPGFRFAKWLISTEHQTHKRTQCFPHHSLKREWNINSIWSFVSLFLRFFYCDVKILEFTQFRLMINGKMFRNDQSRWL
jgi:hypothetical protein